jgi:hypothetical protein
MAYEAGQRCAESEPADRRHPDACPFEPGTDESRSWLEGFASVVGDAKQSASLHKALDDAIAFGDKLNA